MNVNSGDARVTVTEGEPEIEVISTVEAMYGRAIREQAEKVRRSWGDLPVRIQIEDAGALPFVLAARLDAALGQYRNMAMVYPQIKLPDRPARTLRRTRLYVPGNTPKVLVNAGLYGADGVILDLEDSVPDGEKIDARILVAHALGTVDFGASERMVRVNTGSHGLADIAALAQLGVEVFLIPKTESALQVRQIDDLLTQLHSSSRLLPILESARGVHLALEIAEASHRVVGIALGIEDYLADLRATKTPGQAESEWAHGQVVNAARAAGVSPFASVFALIDDANQMEAYARRMAMRGFDGVGCIHPGQVQPAHRGFAPSDEELAQARAIVAANAEGGAVRVDGMMVDAPVLRRAQQTLARAVPR